MISVHSQGGREGRGTTVEQSVSSDPHKLLCLHLTLTAMLLSWGQQAKSSFHTFKCYNHMTVKKHKLWPAEKKKATSLMYLVADTSYLQKCWSESITSGKGVKILHFIPETVFCFYLVYMMVRHWLTECNSTETFSSTFYQDKFFFLEGMSDKTSEGHIGTPLSAYII